MFVAVGGDDTRFGPFAQQIADASQAVGADTHRTVSPGTAHDWRIVQYAWEQALPLIAARAGMGTS